MGASSSSASAMSNILVFGVISSKINSLNDEQNMYLNRPASFRRSYSMMTFQSASSGALKLCVSIAVLIVGPAMAAPPQATASFPISDKSFKCITQMTHVRHFYVDNLAGNLVGTVKVAQAATGNYPVGSVLQLVPTEVMVKTRAGLQCHDARLGVL